MEIIMKTFYDADGNYADIPLKDILDRMTDDWIEDEVTGENISELRDACRKLLETAHNSDYAKCKEVLRLIFEATMAADRLCELYDSFDGEFLDMANRITAERYLKYSGG